MLRLVPLAILLLAVPAGASGVAIQADFDTVSRLELGTATLAGGCEQATAYGAEDPRMTPVAHAKADRVAVEVYQGGYISTYFTGIQRHDPAGNARQWTDTHEDVEVTIYAHQPEAMAFVSCRDATESLFDVKGAVLHRPTAAAGDILAPSGVPNDELILTEGVFSNYRATGDPRVILRGHIVEVVAGNETFRYESGVYPSMDVGSLGLAETGYLEEIYLKFEGAVVSDLAEAQDSTFRRLTTALQHLDGLMSFPKATGFLELPGGRIALDGQSLAFVGQGFIRYLPADSGGLAAQVEGNITDLWVDGQRMEISPQAMPETPGPQPPSAMAWSLWLAVPLAFALGLAIRSIRRLRNPDLLVIAAEDALSEGRPRRAFRLARRALGRTQDDEAVMLMGVAALQARWWDRGLRCVDRLERHDRTPAMDVVRRVLASKPGDPEAAKQAMQAAILSVPGVLAPQESTEEVGYV